MRFVKLLLGWVGLTVMVVGIYGMNAKGSAEMPENGLMKRPDVIAIQTMKRFKPSLERPPVVFQHDRHTEALLKQEKDCTSCHVKGKNKNRISLTFKSAGDGSGSLLMDIYHDNCIGCHQEMAAEKEETGPVTCGECHLKEPQTISQTDPMGFDKSLHYRHVNANQNKCDACHHEYDETLQKTFYAKGKEGSCRYCHKQDDQKTGMRFQTAAHLSCISCHLKKKDEGAETGPVDCRGCHDKEKKKTIKSIDPVPRIDRKQPDFVLVKRFNPKLKIPPSEYRMKQVPFDHKGHEESQKTCRSCHHEALSACSECHTMAGSDKGDFVKLEKAMHQDNAKMSCAGCHDTMTQQIQCGGCHRFIKTGGEKAASSCISCHVYIEGPDGQGEPKARSMAQAKAVMDNRAKAIPVFDVQKAPETVTIKTLEKKYGPVELPHGKIVRSLMERIKTNRLANFFHNGTETICQGCHHNSPKAEKPPRCSTCHGKPFDEERFFVPGLMGAYHQQCMGCHQEMKIEKQVSTDCTGCHKEKENVRQDTSLR